MALRLEYHLVSLRPALPHRCHIDGPAVGHGTLVFTDAAADAQVGIDPRLFQCDAPAVVLDHDVVGDDRLRGCGTDFLADDTGANEYCLPED